LTGLLVPPGDPAALATAIAHLASSDAERDAMGQAALEKSRREFDERDVVARVMDSYRLAAARRRTAFAP
jgi:glycosyltransferase involved in cell wall biosynthesis